MPLHHNCGPKEDIAQVSFCKDRPYCEDSLIKNKGDEKHHKNLHIVQIVLWPKLLKIMSTHYNESKCAAEGKSPSFWKIQLIDPPELCVLPSYGLPFLLSSQVATMPNYKLDTVFM